MLTDEEFDSFLKALGLHIRHLRKEKKVNMRDIMISTGFYDSQWRKYEAGGGLNLRSLMKIAQALKVTLVELLDGLGQWPEFSVEEIGARHHIASNTEPDLVHLTQPITKSSPDRTQPMKRMNVKRAAKKTAGKPGALPVRPSRATSK